MPRERPLIASVIYNRLQRGHPARHRRHDALRHQQLDEAAHAVGARASTRPTTRARARACRPGRSAAPAWRRSGRPRSPRSTGYLFYVVKPRHVRRARLLGDRRRVPARRGALQPRARAPRRQVAHELLMAATLLGVAGFPVGHSRSPAMHNAAFARARARLALRAAAGAAELFAETVAALPGSGFRGINVTIPHKVAALEAAPTAAAAAAAAIGAANTLTFADGAIARRQHRRRRASSTRSATPAAGGGAWCSAPAARPARCVWALREAGAEVSRLEPHAGARRRAGERARRAPRRASRWRPTCSSTARPSGWTPRPGCDAALTALGLTEAEPPALVVDLVYRRRLATPLVAWARGGGARMVDGLEVLVRQGARSLERWTGTEPPLDCDATPPRRTA